MSTYINRYKELKRQFIEKWQPGYVDTNGVHLDEQWEKDFDELLKAQFKRTIELFSSELIKNFKNAGY